MEKGNEIKTVVPALRFPEFQNTEGWKEYILGDFLLEQPRYGINAPAVPFQAKLPTYIRITDISENGYFLPSPKVSVNQGPISDFYLKIGDLVFARTGASVGKCYKYKEKDGKLVFAGFLIKVSPDQTRLSSSFLFQFTFTQQYWKWIDLTSTRSGQPGINSKELASMELYLPVKDEQQKIANCLFSLDELIEATAQKVEALKEHKKGLMQRLFPAEGKNVPDLRFPEFQRAQVWEEKKLGEKGVFYGGGTPDRSNSSYWTGNIGWISSSDLMEDNIHHIAITRFINEKAINKSATKIIPKECVLFVSRVGVGKIAVNKEELCTSQDFTNFQPTKGLSSYFVGYYFLSKKKYLKSHNQGTSIKGFSRNDIKKTTIVYPFDIKEQQKIADCFSSLDELIEATSRKVEILKEHKKGLMQQLFPKI